MNAKFILNCNSMMRSHLFIKFVYAILICTSKFKISETLYLQPPEWVTQVTFDNVEILLTFARKTQQYFAHFQDNLAGTVHHPEQHLH